MSPSYFATISMKSVVMLTWTLTRFYRRWCLFSEYAKWNIC